MGTTSCRNPNQEPDQSKIGTVNCHNPICRQAGVQSQNKQPIQFSEIQSNPSQKQEQKQGNIKEITDNISIFNTTSKSNAKMLQNTGASFRQMNSTSRKISECVFVSKFSNSRIKDIQGNNNYQPLAVSFSVIKLMIPEQIKSQLMRIDKNFMNNHSDPSNSSYRGWKLEASGFYSNICTTDQNTLLISEDQFFKGKTLSDTFVPEQYGVLINKDGHYRGEFHEGKAQGKGTYVWNSIYKQFTGIWEDGHPKNGEIKARNYVYKGQFKKGIPDGLGKLTIKSQKGQFNYQGSFKEGKFSGQGKYECPGYVYEGQFREGKKNGKGSFIEKKRKNKSKSRFDPPLELEGHWLNDTFLKVE